MPGSYRRSAGRSALSVFRMDVFWAWGMLAPALIGFAVFLWGPVLYAILLSFFDWDLLMPKSFVGIDNYVRMFQDPMFYHSLRVTLLFVVLFVPASIALSMVLAILLNRIRFAVLFRTLFFLPAISMSVAVGLVWTLIFNPKFGILNAVLGWVGLPQPGWIFDPHTAVLSVAIMGVWSSLGYNAIFYLAALQNIPRSVYEAAEIDGATGWRKTWYMTVPLVSPTTFFLVIIKAIAAFQAFDAFYVMTNGGPGDATTTLVFYIFNKAFRTFEIGYASTMSTALFVLVILVTLVQFAFQKKWVYYER